MSKWNKQYFTDLAERAGASAVGGALTMVTADAAGVADYSERAWWVLVGIPTSVSLLKGLLVNLGTGDTPTASLVKVTSNGEPDPVPGV